MTGPPAAPVVILCRTQMGENVGTAARAMRLFSYSITYVTLLFGAMALDALVG